MSYPTPHDGFLVLISVSLGVSVCMYACVCGLQVHMHACTLTGQVSQGEGFIMHTLFCVHTTLTKLVSINQGAQD